MEDEYCLIELNGISIACETDHDLKWGVVQEPNMECESCSLTRTLR